MPQGNNNKRRGQKIIREQRLQLVAPLWRKSWTLKEIRDEVMKKLDLDTYSLGTVHKDVQRLINEWREYRLEDTDDKITAELARIDLVIKEAWAAWEKSKEDYEKRSTTAMFTPKKDKQGVKITMESVKQFQNEAMERCYGNPKYLDIILKAMEQRCKLLGLNKTALEVSAASNGAIEIRYVDAGIPCATSEEEVRTREGLTY